MKAKKSKRVSSYSVVFTPAREGGYTATVPALSGCVSEGDTFEQAKKNISEAITLYLEVAGRNFPGDQGDFIVAPVSVSL